MGTTTMNGMRAGVDRVGEMGLLEMQGLRVPVRIVDAKESYGCLRFWVEPVGGTGRKWVDAGRVGPSAQAPAGAGEMREALEGMVVAEYGAKAKEGEPAWVGTARRVLREDEFRNGSVAR